MGSSHGELCVAIINNNRQQITKILSQKIDLNCTVSWDSITLKPASSRKKSAKKKEENNVYEALPLNLAVIFSSVEVVEELLSHGANPILKDGRSRSAIICAVYGDLDTLIISPENFLQITACNERHGSEHYSYSDIIQHANSPQEGPFLRGITPLCSAAYLGKADIVAKLIDMGVSVDSTDKNGATALMYAVRDGHVAVVQELLARHASIEIQDNNGWKAAQYGKKFPEIIKLLEENILQKIGANNIFPPDLMADLQVKYPSFYADFSSFLAPYGNLEAISTCKNSLYTSAEVQTDSQEEKLNFESLASCVASGNVHGLKMLLDKHQGAANMIDEESGLPIILYVLRYRPLNLEISYLMVKILVSCGADLKKTDILTGMNALHFLLHDPFLLNDDEKSASSDLIFQIARFLSESGCNPDMTDALGNRPLHYACQMGDWKTVKSLVHDYNSDLFKPNSNGKIPLDYVTSEEIRDFISAEMRQKGAVNKALSPIEFPVEMNLQVEPLQRIQDYLLKAFADTSTLISQELNKEVIFYSNGNTCNEEETILNASESVINSLDLRVNQLEDELDKMRVETSQSILERDQIILNFEDQLQNLQISLDVKDGQLKSSNVQLDKKCEELLELEAQYNTLKQSLANSMEAGVNLASQLKDIERNRAQQITSLQTRIIELENLAKRKDEVIRQMGETHRVFDSVASPRENAQSDSGKITQLDLHSDILKANLEAVIDDLRTLKEKGLGRNDKEIQRLEKERLSLEHQMNQVMNERKSFMESPESTPNRSSRGFMHLEDLLGQLQVNSVEVSPPYTPEGSPVRKSVDFRSHRMSYRMSTIINQEECDLDPSLVNRLLDAAKRKIQRLKRRCENFEEETLELRSQVEEKEIHIKDTYALLQAANRRAAEIESKLSRRGADQDKVNMKFREFEKERNIELSHLQKIIEEFIGPSSHDESDQDSLQGILGMIHSLFWELDPVLLGSLPPHLVNPTSDDIIQLADLSDDSAVDSRRYNAHLLQVLTDVAARIKEYLHHLGSALGNMKNENKKFVKEIMKLKKEAVVKSLVANVRDSLDPRRVGRLDLSDNDFRKLLQKNAESSHTSPSSVPVRPARMDRQSVVSHHSHAAASEASGAFSVSGMTSEASDIMDSLKRLKLEISHLQALENPSSEATAKVIELKKEYRTFVKRLMDVLKTDTPSEPVSSTSQELKDRLKQMSSNLSEIKESLTT